MLSLIKTITYMALFSLITLSLTSCSKETVAPEQRAVERWNALIAKDWDKAYTFQTPNYRKTYKKDSYKNNYGAAVEWKSIKLISSKKISDKITDVKLELKSTFAGGGNLVLPSQIVERWQLIDGQWWHVKK